MEFAWLSAAFLPNVGADFIQPRIQNMKKHIFYDVAL